MKLPKLRTEKRITKFHNYKIVDYYSWVHQKDILSVLSDPSKLNKEVRKYLEQENSYSNLFLRIIKNSKKLFKEIKRKNKTSRPIRAI